MRDYVRLLQLLKVVSDCDVLSQVVVRLCQIVSDVIVVHGLVQSWDGLIMQGWFWKLLRYLLSVQCPKKTDFYQYSLNLKNALLECLTKILASCCLQDRNVVLFCFKSKGQSHRRRVFNMLKSGVQYPVKPKIMVKINPTAEGGGLQKPPSWNDYRSSTHVSIDLKLLDFS